MGKGFKQGYFTPTHPEKYNGKVNNIRFMSSYELTFFKFLDNNPAIISWASEEIAIPYLKPTTGRVHKYYPDLWVKYTDRHGNIKQEIIEIKPEKQTKKPTTRGKNKKTQLYETLSFAVNVAKWKSCKLFCDKYGMEFRIITEKDIFR